MGYYVSPKEKDIKIKFEKICSPKTEELRLSLNSAVNVMFNIISDLIEYAENPVKENEIAKNILTKHTEIGGVNIISLITETIFNMVFLGEGISKSTLLYELKDFIEGTEQGENDLLFDLQNCFEITRRIILHLSPSESIENFSRKRRDHNG